MINHPVVLWGLVAALASSPLVAQEAPVVSLDEALRMFAANSLELRAARARSDEAAGLARQAGAFANPSLMATHEPLSGGGRAYSETYLTVSQRLEISGTRGARADAGALRWEAARALVHADSARLAFEVKEAFLEAALAQESFDVTERVADVFREAARSATERYEAGDISLYALRRIRVERARYETLLLDADLDVAATQRALALVVAPEDDALRLAAEPLPTDTPPDLLAEGLQLTVIERRPELVAARADFEAQEAQARFARAERIPVVTATGGLKRQSDGLRGAFLGLSVPFPIFDRNAGAVDAADAGARGAQERLTLTERQLQNDVLRATDAYAALRRRAALLTDDAIGDTADLLEIALVAYDAGDMELVELLDAAEALHQARTAEAHLLAQLWIAHFDLERAVGGFAGAPSTEDGQ
ncbi:MAG: TolC family protein [Gemmatimonadetes bacterium]|nr:TolC family protein [Gemmatimonadota bacterium]